MDFKREYVRPGREGRNRRKAEGRSSMTTAGTAVGLLIASVFAWIYMRA